MTISKDDVVRWFGLNEGEGLQTKDSHTGEVLDLYREDDNENPWKSPGKVGAAAFYGGSGFNDTFAILDEKPLPYSDSWAIHCWLEPLSSQESDSGWPISRYDDVSGDREWAFYYQTTDHASGAALGFAARFLDSGGTEHSVSVEWSGTDAESGAWVFVTWDRETSTLKFYANGVERDSVVVSGTGPHDLVEASGSGTQLSFFQPYGFATQNRYRGEIDEVAFLSGRAFDSDDAEWLYNDGAGRDYDTATTQPPTEEEVFEASFEDASGRDPFPSALLQRTPARKLANHYVSIYKYPPYLVTKRVPIALEDYDLTKPGNMIWHKDANSALFSMGRWAQIQGRRFTDNPVEIELTLRISDHAESFEAPS